MKAVRFGKSTNENISQKWILAYWLSYSVQLHKQKAFILKSITTNENTAVPFALLQQKERGYKEWRYGADLWDLGNGNGKARLVYLFPMEMKILVSGQRRAVSISLKWFNSTFKLSCGNWYYLTFSRQSVYIFAFISQLKANWNCPVQIEIKIHFAYRLGKKATGWQKQALLCEAI